MALFFRRDDWVQDAMGNALSGAGVWVTSQPSTPATITKAGFVPPTPQVQLYADSAGTIPITQPVQTDGYGHAFYYTGSNIYTVTYFSPQIGIVTLPDQIITGVAPPPTINPLQGMQNGTNRVFTLISTPISYAIIYVNGIFQAPGTNYSISGPTVTFTVAPISTDQLWSVFQ